MLLRMSLELLCFPRMQSECKWRVIKKDSHIHLQYMCFDRTWEVVQFCIYRARTGAGCVVWKASGEIRSGMGNDNGAFVAVCICVCVCVCCGVRSSLRVCRLCVMQCLGAVWAEVTRGRDRESESESQHSNAPPGFIVLIKHHNTSS